MRDDLRGYVIDAFGDPEAVLVVDETGDLKKGTQSVGVQRQYTGTAGRIENAQVAVFLTYAARRGHALIDRALYLPQSWTDDPDRCARRRGPGRDRVRDQTGAGRGDDHPRRRRPGCRRPGSPVTRSTAPTRTCARPSAPRAWAMSCRSRRTGGCPPGPGRCRVDELAANLPDTAWQRRSAGNGSKGPRYYSWAWLALLPRTRPRHRRGVPGGRASPAGAPQRRHRRTGLPPRYTPGPTAAHPGRVAGQRWRVEENFQAAKRLVGLDQHQVRRWTSWHRWTTLAMLAHAFLAVATASNATTPPPRPDSSNSPSTNSAASSTPCCSPANTPSTPCWPGHAGADDTKPAPATATTDDATNTNDHELRL